MNRGFLLGLLVLACPDAASQSSVRVYGILDVGIDYVSSATPAGKSLVRVTSGGANTSRWGLRGREELGGGLAAIWQLEGSLLLDAGGGDMLFRRQANVGFEGQFGRLVFGRSFTTVHDLVTLFDPMALAQFYSWTVSASATGPNRYGYTTSFDNMAKYLGTFGPVQVGINYGFGEQAGNRRDGARFALSMVHRAGPWSAMATWEEVNGNLAAASGRREKTTVAHVGAMFQQGPVKWTAVARRYQLAPSAPAAPEAVAVTSWTGLNYVLGAATWTVAVYHVNVVSPAIGADADPTMLVLSYRHQLSPRTDVYLALSRASAPNGRLAGVLRDIPGYAGSQRGMALGLQQRF